MRINTVSSESRGGVESAIQGFATSIGPILIFAGLFGGQSFELAFFATLVTATVVHAAHLLLGSHPALMPCARVASLAVFASLVLQLARATPDAQATTGMVSPYQLYTGWVAASALFFLASLLVLLFGLFKLGNLFKMIPTPVTSGISNGTALLLVWLAAVQLHGAGSALPLAIAVLMLVVYLGWDKAALHLRVLRAIPSALAAPVVGIALLWLTHSGAQPVATTAGLNGAWIAAPHWVMLLDSNMLRLLALGLPGAITLAIIMVLETFTAASIMETRFGVQVDANRELLALGGANLVGAALGGVPSTGSPVRSVSNWLAGGRGRLASLVCLGVTAVLVVALQHWLMALPVAISAGLFFMQAHLLLDKRFAARLHEMVLRRAVRRDRGSDQAFWLSLSIALVAFFASLVWASLIGIAVSCLIVLRRLSDRLTARWDYLDRYRSRRVRTPAQDEIFSQHAHHIAVLRLAGHLFFGNSLRISQLADELHRDTMAVVVDVSQVSDVDPSASDALVWLLRTLQGRGKAVVLSGLHNTPSQELRHTLGDFADAVQYQDLDRGMEHCEDLVLQAAGGQAVASAHQSAEKNRLLADLTEDELTAVLLLSEVREVPAGSCLFERDTLADGVWLLERGSVSILVGTGWETSRLATFGPGQFLGEMGFVDGKARSASAVADTAVRAIFIDNQAFAALRRSQPDAVIKITINIARELSQRVRNTSALLTDRNSQESSQWSQSALSAFSKF